MHTICCPIETDRMVEASGRSRISPRSVHVDHWSYRERCAASSPRSWVPTEGCESTFIKKEGSTRRSEVDRAQPCRVRPRWLYEGYICLSNAEEPIEATDVGVRHGTTWVTANDGWKCSRSGGPESRFPMALPWTQERGGSAQWLECSEGALCGRCCIFSSSRRWWRKPCAATGSVSVSVRSLHVCSAAGNAIAVIGKKTGNVRGSVTNQGVDYLTARARFDESDCRNAPSAFADH